MKAQELRQKYLDFFVKKGHKIIPSVSLVPEEKINLAGTQKVLFTTAGMHSLIPYLLGESHPEGKRLVNVQKCLRTDDLEEVGDSWHNTFFEMLGNWSLGDYWKEEAISWSLEFLTKELNFPLDTISVTIFAGDHDSPKDEESEKIWQKLSIPQERIYPLPKKDNWWGPVGETGPCGPDTEMFYDTGRKKCGSNCLPGCSCGKYAEIWNDVFMEHEKTAEGNYKQLKQRNVDTGMGLERAVAILQGKDNIYETELFRPIIQQLEERLEIKYKSNNGITTSLRIIADHLKASAFLISDGVRPSNKEQGYVLRKLIRRSVFKTFLIKRDFDSRDFRSLTRTIIGIYPGYFKEIDSKEIEAEISLEVRKFRSTVERGYKEIKKHPTITGKIAFDLYQTYGFPLELTREVAEGKGQIINEDEFRFKLEKHQELSRTASAGMFRGGLLDESEQTIKYHTATHLLHQALRQILGKHVWQSGSNITVERLRFDFSHHEKMTDEQIKKAEDLVNQKIKENLPVEMEEVPYEQAIKDGALAFFGERYSEQVKVYSIGNFSKEVCGGPHVDFTGGLGVFKIVKEESAAKNVRRIYARLD